MKKTKWLFHLLTVCFIMMSISIPVTAASPITDNTTTPQRVIDDDYIYQNYEFEGDMYKFSTTAEKPYFRIAVQNTTSKTMSVALYTVVDGKEEPYSTISIKPGVWGGIGTKYKPSTDFVIRISCKEGITPTGLLSVRIAAQDFLRAPSAKR